MRFTEADKQAARDRNAALIRERAIKNFSAWDRDLIGSRRANPKDGETIDQLIDIIIDRNAADERARKSAEADRKAMMEYAKANPPKPFTPKPVTSKQAATNKRLSAELAVKLEKMAAQKAIDDAANKAIADEYDAMVASDKLTFDLAVAFVPRKPSTPFITDAKGVEAIEMAARKVATNQDWDDAVAMISERDFELTVAAVRKFKNKSIVELCFMAIRRSERRAVKYNHYATVSDHALYPQGSALERGIEHARAYQYDLDHAWMRGVKY